MKTINIINVINHANGKIDHLGTVLEPDLAAMNDYDLDESQCFKYLAPVPAEGWEAMQTDHSSFTPHTIHICDSRVL